MEPLQYLVGTIGFLAGLALSTQMVFALIQLYFANKAGIDLVDFLQNRDIRRTLDDKLKLLFYRMGKDVNNLMLMNVRNRRIVGIKYSYSIITLLTRGWRDCWNGMIYLHVETEGPLHLEIMTVVEVLPDFKEEALKLLLARKVLLNKRHEKMDLQ